MTTKEFFIKKIIPQIEEQIFTFEFQLVRNQYIFERLKSELENLEKMPLLAGENVEKALRERAERKAEVEKQLQEVQRNINFLPIIIEEEKKFLEYFKTLVEKMEN